MRPFSACLGSWRPDFLVETRRFATKEVVEERFIITEINARFSFNGFVHEAYGQQALYEVLLDAGVEDVGLVNATEPMMVISPNIPECFHYFSV